MKKLLSLFTLVVVAGAMLAAQVKGPTADKILFDVKLQEDIGLKDAAEGKSDFFYYGANGSAFKVLPDDVKSKLESLEASAANLPKSVRSSL